jgi:hypothetical protein
MVFPDGTRNQCTPHGETVLAGNLPSGFTPARPIDIKECWQPTAYSSIPELPTIALPSYDIFAL